MLKNELTASGGHLIINDETKMAAGQQKDGTKAPWGLECRHKQVHRPIDFA